MKITEELSFAPRSRLKIFAALIYFVNDGTRGKRGGY